MHLIQRPGRGEVSGVSKKAWKIKAGTRKYETPVSTNHQLFGFQFSDHFLGEGNTSCILRGFQMLIHRE